MSNDLDLYPLTLDQTNRRVGVNIATPTARLDVNGDTLVRANVTSTSNVHAATSFKLGGVIGNDTSLFSEGASAMNVIGKRFVPSRDEPFEVGTANLRTVSIYDRLAVEGALRLSTSLKIAGAWNDTDLLVSNNASALNFVGPSSTKLVVVYDRLNVEGPVRTSTLLEVGGKFGDDNMQIGKGAEALHVVGNGTAPNRVVNVYDNLVVDRVLSVPSRPNLFMDGQIFALT